jgi:putative membrane protein
VIRKEMMLEILLSILIGTLAGTVTGLIPGIHTNLISALILSALPLLLTHFSPILLAVLIISMAVTHTFTSAIPSIFLGAPDESTALATLPGHQLLLKGEGYHAVYLTVIGSVAAVLLAVLTAPLSIPLVKSLYPLVKPIIPYLLITASIILIIKDKHSRFWALICFLLAGILGIATFSVSIKQPLLPLLTGLFGVSLLILSINEKIKIPPQKTEKKKIRKSDILQIVPRSGLASLLCAFLPGLGSSQAAILALPSGKDVSRENFLLLIGAIDTFMIVFDLFTFYAISRTRNGSIITISEMFSKPDTSTLLFLIIAVLFSSLIAAILTMKISKSFSRMLARIDYSSISIAVLVFLFVITSLLSGPVGVLVLITASSLGIIAQIKGVRKSHLMGCLIIPVILNALL